MGAAAIMEKENNDQDYNKEVKLIYRAFFFCAFSAFVFHNNGFSMIDLRVVPETRHEVMC